MWSWHINTGMISAFDLDGSATAEQLYSQYRNAFVAITECPLPSVLKASFLTALTETYDLAVKETSDAMSAQQSPRSPRQHVFSAAKR